MFKTQAVSRLFFDISKSREDILAMLIIISEVNSSRLTQLQSFGVEDRSES